MTIKITLKEIRNMREDDEIKPMLSLNKWVQSGNIRPQSTKPLSLLLNPNPLSGSFAVDVIWLDWIWCSLQFPLICIWLCSGTKHSLSVGLILMERKEDSLDAICNSPTVRCMNYERLAISSPELSQTLSARWNALALSHTHRGQCFSQPGLIHFVTLLP